MNERPLVFGMGLGRTGTISLHIAMSKLGWKSFHAWTVFEDALRSQDTSAPEKLFGKLISEGYNAFFDFPSVDWYKRVVDAYPGAKFIFTKRPVEDWIESREWFAGAKRIGWTTDRDELRKYFSRHYAQAVAYCDERHVQRMIFRACEGDGWDKLCDFLGVARLPAAAFPHGNKRPRFEFTSDWLSGRLDEWGKLFQGWNARKVHALEIGSYEGRSACWLLLNVLPFDGSTLTCIEPFPRPILKRRFLHNIATTNRAEKVQLLHGCSHQLLHLVPDDSKDLVYVDGEHEGRSVVLDGLLAWSKLKPGGLMVFDDYGWPDAEAKRNNRHCHPREGVNAFLAVNSWDCSVVHKGYQVVVRKNTDGEKS